MKIAFAAPNTEVTGTLAVGVLPDGVLTASAAALDAATDGAIRRALEAAKTFKAKPEQTLSLWAPAGAAATRIVLYGLGKADGLDGATCQKIGGGLAALFAGSKEAEATVIVDAVDGAATDAADAAAELAYGALLRSYRFDTYKTRGVPGKPPAKSADATGDGEGEEDETPPTFGTLTVMVADADSASDRFSGLHAVAEGVFLTRDLVSEPANHLYPAVFAERCRELEALGVEVEILDDAKMAELGMGALLAVGQGSARDSRLVIMQWKGAEAGPDGPVAFVGKGVTFDTGGISLKPAGGMEDMKWDMGGAGVVTGLMKALAGRKAKVHAIGVIGLVENMPSGTATRPGDIVTSLSGQTIEILNTDAEGRLVLADALWYTQDRFKPRFMVNLATLTGAIIVALGNEYAGLMSNNDELSDRLAQAGTAEGEKVWRLPLGKEYDKQLDSPAADMKNIGGGRAGGSIVAGQFLQRFVNTVPWAHLDIAGVTWSSKDAATVPKGGTAFGVRLLNRLVADHYEG